MDKARSLRLGLVLLQTLLLMMKLQTPVLPVPVADNSRSLKVLPLSDLHLTTEPESTSALLSNRDYLERMDHVILLGDMVGTYGTEEEYEALWEFVRDLQRPYSAVNGNHEFYFRVYPGEKRLWTEATPYEKTMQLQRFRQFFGLERLWRMEKTALGAFIFLGLDDVKNSKSESLSERQLAWLESALREVRGTPTYLFCHAPLLLDRRLDMHYYDTERTACVELGGVLFELMNSRNAPLFWMSGHIHLRPDHYLFPPYEIKRDVWQIHCPDSWGFSRWAREHIVPQRHQGLFSRHLEIQKDRVVFVSHDHRKQADIARYVVEF